MISQIFLDVDGVLADWASPVLDLFGVDDHAAFYADWGDEWNIIHSLGITEAQLWEAIDGLGESFWAGLEPHPWAFDLFALCEEAAPTTLLTSPSRHPSSASGKMYWMRYHFGRDFRKFLIGPDKPSCARPGALLIDDRDDNCKEFVSRGGAAVVFPRPWNSKRAHSDTPVACVARILHELHG